jgi:hypothetical protein
VDFPGRLVLVTLDVITPRLLVTPVYPVFPEVVNVLVRMPDVDAGEVFLTGVDRVFIVPEEDVPQDMVCNSVDPLENDKRVDVVTTVGVIFWGWLLVSMFPVCCLWGSDVNSCEEVLGIDTVDIFWDEGVNETWVVASVEPWVVITVEYPVSTEVLSVEDVVINKCVVFGDELLMLEACEVVVPSGEIVLRELVSVWIWSREVAEEVDVVTTGVVVVWWLLLVPLLPVCWLWRRVDKIWDEVMGADTVDMFWDEGVSEVCVVASVEPWVVIAIVCLVSTEVISVEDAVDNLCVELGAELLMLGACEVVVSPGEIVLWKLVSVWIWS